MNSRGLSQQLLDLRQRLRGGILVEKGSDVGHTLLHPLHALLVRSADSAHLERVDLVDQAVRLVRQLTDDAVPLGEALVAAPAVGEGSGVSAGADVAARTRHTLHARALAAAFVTLRLGGPARVAVARWDRNAKSDV